VIDFKQVPVADLIVVEMDDAAPGTIKLPDWARTLSGTVVAVGPGAPIPGGTDTAPMQTKVGDRVIFGAAAGMDSVYKNRAVRVMRDSDVDMVVE